MGRGTVLLLFYLFSIYYQTYMASNFILFSPIIKQAMSRIITNTNIIVDDFNFCKSFPKGTFVHFLTHYHSDHYEGLTPLWDYGQIHCSHQTKKFIKHNFPKIKNVYSYNYYEEQTIQIRPNLFIKFYLFDAKHIPGSAMILFRGYMGRILFTGDFRYNFDMVRENPILFPPSLRSELMKKDQVEKMSGISIPIDQMIFDNTYCNENFKFQQEATISKLMIDIIEKNQNKQLVYIAMGALGKHRILQQIAKYFQTNIVVSEKQLDKIKVAGLATNFLTVDPDEGYIRLISKKNRQKIIEKTKKSSVGENFICIDTDFLMLEHQSPDQINYIVPYSLHSNFKEMETFIRMIKPCILRKLVIPYSNLKKVKLRIKIDHRLKFSKYLDFLESKLYKSESGYSHLVRHHTQVYHLSQEFLEWFDPYNQQKLNQILQVGQQDHNLRKRPIYIDEDSSQSMWQKSQKQSLKTIADSLNAVHKNKTVEQSFADGRKNSLNKSCLQLYKRQSREQKGMNKSEDEQESEVD